MEDGQEERRRRDNVPAQHTVSYPRDPREVARVPEFWGRTEEELRTGSRRQEEYRRSENFERPIRMGDLRNQLRESSAEMSRVSSRERRRKRPERRGTSDEESTTDSGTEGRRSSVEEEVRRFSKKNPVVRFRGVEDLSLFLEDVEEQRDIHDIREDQLLSGIGALLEGDAKTWYRQRKNQRKTWAAFKRMIRKAFQPCEDDEAILDKLKKMKQRGTETYDVYETRMGEWFRRLEEPLSEKKKVKILLNGLQLFYGSRICEDDVHSLSQLRQMCMRPERDKARITRLEKEKDKDKMNREKQEKSSEEKRQRKEGYGKPWSVHAVEETGLEEIQIDAVKALPKVTEATQCWRCGIFGSHLASQCTEKIFCRTCGQPGTIAENCRRCFAAYQEGLWKNESFQQGTWTGRTQVPHRFPYPPPPIPRNPTLATAAFHTAYPTQNSILNRNKGPPVDNLMGSTVEDQSQPLIPTQLLPSSHRQEERQKQQTSQNPNNRRNQSQSR